jgi:hypothetical protein
VTRGRLLNPALAVLAIALSACAGGANHPTAKASTSSTPSAPGPTPTVAASFDPAGGADLFKGTPAERWGSDAAAFGPVTGRGPSPALLKTAVDYARGLLVAGNLVPKATTGESGDVVRMLRQDDQRFLVRDIQRTNVHVLVIASEFGVGTKILGSPRVSGAFTATTQKGILRLRWQGTVIYPVSVPDGRGLVPIWRSFTWLWPNAQTLGPFDEAHVRYEHVDGCATRSAAALVPQGVAAPIPARYYRAGQASDADFKKDFPDADNDGLDDRVKCP